MGIHTALVSAEGPDDDKHFSAVNHGLDVDANTQQDFKKTSPNYSEAGASGGDSSSDGGGKTTPTTTESASDTQSTSSRTDSPDSSQADIRHATITVEPAEFPTPLPAPRGKNKQEPLHIAHIIPSPHDMNNAFPQQIKPDPLSIVSLDEISTLQTSHDDVASVNCHEITSEEVQSSAVAVDLHIPPLLALVPTSKTQAQKTGLRDRVATGWTYAKRLQTFPRDMRALSRYLRLLYRMRKARRANLNVPTAFDQTTARHPDKVAFYFEDQQWTFAQVQAYSLRVASVFQGKVAKGDPVALLMENRVEYIAVWLGLSRLGAVPALLNSNLRLKSLAHCITSANCKMVVCGVELQDALLDISAEVGALPTYVSGAGDSAGSISLPGALNLDTLQSSAATVLPSEQQSVNFTDNMVYIYTSGTTGLPKAAVITHSRYIMAGVGMLCIVGVTPQDVLYEPLPLYHTAGGNIGVGMTLCDGVTVAIRKRFSASNYFADCKKYGCTVAQYIGEICRYLLNNEPQPTDTDHKIRAMFGNGLRPQIWEQFQQRFNIPRISEFYGSTEGNANIINMDGRVGAVGFLSVLLPSVYPCALIRVDTETGAPIRDSRGLCFRCKPGEPGELVGKIIANDPVREFKGYADKRATNKKIITDVFKKGDAAFLSGDMLVMDEEGYLFFKDRTGDTFRWKGENVSTAEVENHVSSLVGSTDICVYGVEVPHTEGRAGMAAVLDPEGKLDLTELAKGVTSLLPPYARPLFVRPVNRIEMTGTYKLRKTDLQKEAFDISAIKDPVYFLDAKKVAYVPLTRDLYDRINSGNIRV